MESKHYSREQHLVTLLYAANERIASLERSMRAIGKQCQGTDRCHSLLQVEGAVLTGAGNDSGGRNG